MILHTRYAHLCGEKSEEICRSRMTNTPKRQTVQVKATQKTLETLSITNEDGPT